MTAVATDAAGFRRIAGAIGAAHFASHFFQLVLPSSFVLMHLDLGLSYVDLGILSTIFFAVSGLCQIPVGFMVDRFGAKPILIGGLTCLSGSILLVGLFPSYPVLVVLMVLAGIGNAVFHPADFALLNASIDPGHIGRAFSFHSLGGSLGYALSPVITIALATHYGWQTGMIIMAIVGLCLAVVVALSTRDVRDSRDPQPESTAATGGGADTGESGYRVLMRLVIWLSFLFFALFAAAQIGVQTFTIPLATTLLDLSNTDAAGAVTAYMLAMMLGITIAGQLVDRLPRHEIIALVALACSALVLMFVMVPGSNVYRLYGLLAIAGALFGMIYPSRDMMVRRIAPAHATGRVFGFVYAGLDSGASITPALFGFLVDRGDAALIYPLVAIFIFLAIAIALFNQSRGHSRRASDA